MIVTIHQPEHLPWLGFIHKADRADLLVLLDSVQYRVRYFQNRNRIAGANGVTWLMVPVCSKGYREKTIHDMEIDNTQSWQRAYLATIRQSYSHHPYYPDYAPFFENACTRPWARLADLNEHIIRYFFDVLGVRTPLVRASALAGRGASSELLLDLCLKTGATTYLAGQMAGNYLNEDLFHAQKIAVAHHEFVHPVYPQYKRSEFLSHLSALDLLFNCGPESLAIIRGGAGAAG